MKRQILSGLASLALASAAMGRTDPEWVNNSILICPPSTPPMIDATNFVNNLAFIDNSFNSLFISPYATANTVNYTNLNVLASLTGFRFDTYNPDTDRYTNAANFYNGPGAILNCGGTNFGPYFSTNATFFSSFFSLGGQAECLVSATNIINRGTIDMGIDSLLSLRGQNVSLSGGLLNMEGFETGDIFGNFFTFGSFVRFGGLLGPSGWFDGYWGAGQTPVYNPASYFGFGFPQSPLHWVTNRYYTPMQQQLYLPSATAYQNPLVAQGPSNNLYQVVFLQNADPSVSANVYFLGDSIVEWVWRSTNIVTAATQTNHLFLFDSIPSMPTLGVVPNGIGPPSIGYRATYIPTNYFFALGDLGFLGAPASPGLFNAIGPSTNMTTEYSAYEALFQPTTVIVSDVAGQNYSNAPGRIEITADKQLDLSSSRIAGLNYLRLTAPNNFTNDFKTRILTAVADYNLGVTNATMTVSNLMAPTCPRLDGYVDLFSTRWTNVATVITPFSTNTFTNRYCITMVDSHLTNTAPTSLQNLTLHAPTNVIISDLLNVVSSITIDTYNVTLTANGPGAQTPFGQLNFPASPPLGASAFPRLRNLTNYGIISIQNTAAFGAPPQSNWLSSFVNHGSVLTLGCSIWATNFESTGRVEAGPGAINVTATSAVLSNGVFNSTYNSINLTSGSLFISNQVLNAGLGLTIQATNSLTDGGPASGNVWSAGLFGFSLPYKPATNASLLGTTINDTAPDWATVPCVWAGQDLGPTAAGYGNTNAPLGRLILDGGVNSAFVFSGPGANNALYVDYLEFKNNLTAFDNSGNLANLSFAPGMKIYYAQLIINGVSWAEKLNHRNGGGLNWVATYAGAFSSTNLVYPDGTTNRLNLALVQSCSLDSNGNGTLNCQDPAPVFVPSQMNFAAVVTNAPQRAVVLSWNSVPYATNSVFFKPSVTAANWQLLTNFVLGPTGGRQRVVDPVGAGGRFYRVRVDLAAP
jgi:hypothetical protein